MKEYLYCIPYDKTLPTRKNGIKYHCEKDTNDNNKKENTKHLCDVCSKAFKDARCLKIHKTKMKHHQEDKSANKSSKRGRSNTPPSPSRHGKKLFKS